jgi:hypothetical protein
MRRYGHDQVSTGGWPFWSCKDRRALAVASIENSSDKCPRGDDRNRTGVDGFAARAEGPFLAYLSHFR